MTDPHLSANRRQMRMFADKNGTTKSGGILGQLLSIALLSLSLSACAPSGPLHVPLSYGPTSSLQIKAMGGAVASSTFQLGVIRDARAGDLGVIGENRQDDKPVAVLATPGSVLETVQTAIYTNMATAGLRLVEAGGRIRLDFEVLHLWVEEREIYKATARLRVHVHHEGGPSGVVVVDGTSRRWGSSLSADNYNECLSDALLNAVERMISSPQFEHAVAAEGQIAPTITK